MKLGPYEFNFRELAGSVGDFGTLLPLVIGYLTVCRMDPTGLLVVLGVMNIAAGLFYRIPVPIQPMKVLAVVAIAAAWSPEKVYTSALVMGVVWLVLGFGGVMSRIAAYTPKSVVRGVQLALGVMLAVKGLWMMTGGWLLGLVSLGVVLATSRLRHSPAALVLVVMGAGVAIFSGDVSGIGPVAFTPPPVTMFDPSLIWPVLLEAGFAQIPLTATNAVIAAAGLMNDLWPGRNVTEKQLSISMGAMNLAAPFFGGMPMCHGAGGVVSKHYFGARTGGANIIEGGFEIALGLLFAAGLVAVLGAFPLSVLGALLIMVGIELTKFAGKLRFDMELLTALVVVLGAVTLNMAVGFVAGLALHYGVLWIDGGKNRADMDESSKPETGQNVNG
jgi:MFS superfamily sulfate permease-like transporter